MIWAAVVVGSLVGSALFLGLASLPSPGGSIYVTTATAMRSRTATPTRHPSDTRTEIPKTHTPSATVQPSRTMQPSQTPMPSRTPSLKPTQTPAPPTATPVLRTTTPQPPTATPITVLDRIEVDNGQWGRAPIWVEFQNEIVVNGPDGHRYKAGLGFLSSDESLAAIQECWHRANRGGANWRMKLVVRKQVAWVSCPSSLNVCYESEISPSQAMLTDQVRYSEEVWEDLLNKYLQYGDLAPICGQVPSASCIGFTFAQID